jgi:hypothetical protein
LNLEVLSLGAMGSHVTYKGIVIGPFNYDEQNGYIKIPIRQFWEKGAEEGA